MSKSVFLALFLGIFGENITGVGCLRAANLFTASRGKHCYHKKQQQRWRKKAGKFHVQIQLKVKSQWSKVNGQQPMVKSQRWQNVSNGNPLCFRLFRHRIVDGVFAPGVTTQNPHRSHIRPFERPPHFQGLNGIVRAGGLVPALVRSQKRRERHLVKTDE